MRRFIAMANAAAMKVTESVCRRDIFNLEPVNVHLDGRVLIVKLESRSVLKYYMALSVVLIDRLITICYKNETVIGTAVYGTLCGLHSSHSKYNFDLNIGCGGIADIRNECPAEHQRRDDKTMSCSPTNRRFSCAIAQKCCVCSDEYKRTLVRNSLWAAN